jgi:CRISPR/Cas system-associated protein Csm6
MDIRIKCIGLATGGVKPDERLCSLAGCLCLSYTVWYVDKYALYVLRNERVKNADEVLPYEPWRRPIGNLEFSPKLKHVLAEREKISNAEQEAQLGGEANHESTSKNYSACWVTPNRRHSMVNRRDKILANWFVRLIAMPARRTVCCVFRPADNR